MEPVALNWAAEVMGARIVGTPQGEVNGVCTDTRQGAQGALFFALLGENSDGHQYVQQAFEKGAVGAVVSREISDAGGPLLIVPDTLNALGELAKHYRRKFSIPIVAVTGSVGKTSTKEMVAQVLRSKYCTLANEKNFNNEIGVPLTLFQLTSEHEAAVIEMGMRGLRQIDRLAEIAEPTVGVITNIGWAHIELLGSREKIAEAKAELLTRLPADGIAILPGNDAYYDYLSECVPSGVRILTYGTYDRADRCNIFVDSMYIEYPWNREDESTVSNQRWTPGQLVVYVNENAFTSTQVEYFSLSVEGAHHLHNAAAAFAVAVVLGISVQETADALKIWAGAEGRMNVVLTPDNITILDDCYNAGPESMEAALTTLNRTAASRRIAVLGDMRELGDFAPELHWQIGRKVAGTAVNVLVTVGELAARIGEAAQHYRGEGGKPALEILRFADSPSAAEIRSIVRPGDAVLIKGSRAMQMETVVAALTGQESPNSHA